jgi:hypothetical protein
LSVTETVVPSVRGVQRSIVAGILVGSGVAAAAVVAFALGVVLTPLAAALPDGAPGAVVPALLGAALLADLAHLRSGRPRPLAVGRQVPVEWGRVFPPALTAALYGARLGVGPATILSTWQWWAVAVGAGLLGVWHAVAVGIVFAAVRLGVVVGVSQWATRADPVERFRSLARRGPSASALLAAGTGLALAALLVTGCSGGDDDAGPAGDAPTPPAPTAPAPTTEVPDVSDPDVSDPDDDPFAPPTVTLPPTTEPPPTGPVDPDALAAAVIPDVDGFDPVPAEAADRFLDLDAAAALQPDPTEERPLLETRGFRGGWTRTWRNEQRDVVVATVYEFADAEQAAFYLQDGLITIGGFGGRFFEIAELPDAHGFRQEGVDESGPVVTLGVAFTVGARWHLVFVLGEPETVTRQVLLDAAVPQARAAGFPVVDDPGG